MHVGEGERDERAGRLGEADAADALEPVAAPQAHVPRRRDESLDIAKGFGILLVVLGHCLLGLINSGFFLPQEKWPAIGVFLIYLFHMPLFFWISGHLASGKFRPVGSTIWKMFPTIVYPYFFWSMVTGAIEIYLSRFTTGHLTFYRLYRILWQPIIPYWFLYALFFCHLFYLTTRRLPHLVQLTLAVAIYAAPAVMPAAWSAGNFGMVALFVKGSLYFVLGVVTVGLVKRLGFMAALAATGAFSAMAVWIRLVQPGDLVGYFVVIPATCFGVAATLGWSRVLAGSYAETMRGFGNAVVSRLAFVGRYSMSIFVMHITFTAGVRIALKRLGARPTLAFTVLEIVAALVVGILVPLGINWVISRFDLDRWFGVQHMEAA
jgi:fucose 4-O-acetylase-like acetyltransferase